MYNKYGNDQVSYQEICDLQLFCYDNDKNNQLIEKCIENAEMQCQLGDKLSYPYQNRSELKKHCKAFPLYSEMKNLAKNNQLDDEQSFEDFSLEFKAIQREMDMFLFDINQKENNEKIKNSHFPYEQLLSRINHIEYPLFNHILKLCGVIIEEEYSLENDLLREQKKEFANTLNMYKRRGWDYISTFELETTLNKIQSIPENSEFEEFKRIVISRKALEGRLKNLLKNPNHHLDELKTMQIPPAVRDSFGNQIPENAQPDVLLLAGSCNEYLRESDLEAETLHEKGDRLLQEYISNPVDLRVLTTVALLFEKACMLYIENDKIDEAKNVLKAASSIPVKEWSIGSLNEEELTDLPIYLLKDCGFLRKRRMRVCKKNIDGEIFTELSFELTTKVREDLNKKLALENQCDIRQQTGFYPKKDFSTGTYHTRINGSDVSLAVGAEKRIIFENLGVEILIGDDPSVHNHYHQVRILKKEGISLQNCHKALSFIGLPVVLMESRLEDQENEALGRAISMRFPNLYYGQHKDVQDIRTIYNLLDSDEKKLIDTDVKNMKISCVDCDRYELVNPALGKEVKDHGGVALMTFVNAGDIKNTSYIISLILKSGLLSSQERFQRGIVRWGCNPTINYWAGSADQAFTRLMTKKIFDNEVEIKKLSIFGRVTVLFDVKAFERMPYTNSKDYSGVRNRNFNAMAWMPENQSLEFFVNGQKIIENRTPFPNFVEEFNEDENLQTETMFDVSLAAKYIRKLVVCKEEHKYVLLKELHKSGIKQINGRPVDEVVAVSKTFNNHLLDW